jgi:hypothetical protein
MPQIAQSLFADIIDYAGLFPPARLPMDEALRRFRRHRAGDAGWLLARFVCPAARLAELAALLGVAEPDGPTPIRVAVLGAGGDDAPSFTAALESDLAAMSAFSEVADGRADMDVFEVRFPLHCDPAETVDYVCDSLAAGHASSLTPFFEVPLLGDWREDLALAARAAAVAGHEIDPGRRVGLKIRCGGLEPASFPTVEAVTAAIARCRDSEIPVKATQGLHHPIRHHDAALDVEAHGFVNLLAAVLVARRYRLDERELRGVVAETDPHAFELTDHGLRYGDLEVRAADVSSGRRDGFTSFGSCSFSEPLADLEALGWL